MFEIKKVDPIGERTGRALVKPASGPCVFRDVTEPVYPPSPRGENLRRTRVAMIKSQRDVSRALGISVEQLSGLENARYTFGDPADWDRALDVIRGMAA